MVAGDGEQQRRAALRIAGLKIGAGADQALDVGGTARFRRGQQGGPGLGHRRGHHQNSEDKSRQPRHRLPSKRRPTTFAV